MTTREAIRRIENRAWVLGVDDDDNGWIVTLRDGWDFLGEGTGVRGFDTITEALRETARSNVERVN